MYGDVCLDSVICSTQNGTQTKHPPLLENIDSNCSLPAGNISFSENFHRKLCHNKMKSARKKKNMLELKGQNCKCYNLNDENVEIHLQTDVDATNTIQSYSSILFYHIWWDWVRLIDARHNNTTTSNIINIFKWLIQSGCTINYDFFSISNHSTAFRSLFFPFNNISEWLKMVTQWYQHQTDHSNTDETAIIENVFFFSFEKKTNDSTWKQNTGKIQQIHLETKLI